MCLRGRVVHRGQTTSECGTPHKKAHDISKACWKHVLPPKEECQNANEGCASTHIYNTCARQRSGRAEWFAAQIRPKKDEWWNEGHGIR